MLPWLNSRIGFPSKIALAKVNIAMSGHPPEAIYGEKTKTRGRNAIQMAIGMRHQLVGFFRRRVQADRVIDIVLHRKRQLGIGAIDRR